MEDIASREMLAATRFVYWVSLAWVGFIFASIAMRQLAKGEHGVALLLSLIIACIGLGVGHQQLYWWITEVAQAWGNCQSLDPAVYNAKFCQWVSYWRGYDVWTQVPMLLAICGSCIGTHFFFSSMFDAKFEVMVFANVSIVTAIWIVGLYIATHN